VAERCWVNSHEWHPSWMLGLLFRPSCGVGKTWKRPLPKIHSWNELKQSCCIHVLENALAWFLAPNMALWNSHSSFRGRVTVQVSRAWRLVMITWPTSKDRADSICYNHWLMETIICYNRWRFNLLTTLSWSLRSHLFWRVARTGGDNIDPETENTIISDLMPMLCN
jgi:hypothetical protein